MLQTQCYGIQVSRYTRYKQTNKQTDKQTDYYNPWPPTRLGLTNKPNDYYNPWPPTRLGLTTVIITCRKYIDGPYLRLLER